MCQYGKAYKCSRTATQKVNLYYLFCYFYKTFISLACMLYPLVMMMNIDVILIAGVLI